MIEQIIKKVKDFYNDGRTIKFDTTIFNGSTPISEKLKTFKVGEMRYDGMVYISYVRINDENPDVVEIRYIGVHQIEEKYFDEINN
jgi:hypothetical protein